MAGALSNSKRSSPNRTRQNRSTPARAYQLDVLGLFQAEAGDIAAARTRSQYIHRGGNIRSAGDEVETSVRSYLERRLPKNYTVHHGHFLDVSLSLTPQLDIMIADGGRFPVFFRGRDGLEYLPYEGVHAFGEVKSSITNQDVRDFMRKVSNIRTRLTRAAVPDGYVDKFEETSEGALLYESHPERGHIYRFMFAVSSDQLDVDECLKDLCNADLNDTPNQICLLDRGVIVAGRGRKPDGEVIETFIHPQKMRAPAGSNDIDGWLLATPNGEYPEGATLFYSFTHILEHLKNNVLIPTNYLGYMQKTIRMDTRLVVKTMPNITTR